MKIDFESQILVICTGLSQCNNFIEYNNFLPKHLLLKNLVENKFGNMYLR